MIYIGGVLVLILFSVMLTSRISDVSFSNPSIKYVPGLLLLLLIAGISVFVAIELFGRAAPNQTPATVADIGNALLGRYLLPFYVASVVLFAVLIGAVGIARGYKHIVIEQLPPTNEHPDSPKADQREEERS
jgi:NADH-quinone oxidoreductase subunit J